MNRLLLVLALLCCISGYLYSQQAAAATAAAAPGSHRVALTAQPHEAGKRQAPGPPYQDPRWRMISAMLVLRDFALVMDSRYDKKASLIHVSDGPRSEHLKAIFDRVCNLVAFYQLAININDTDDGRDFYPLLAEVITDACTWMQFLINSTDSMAPGEAANISSNCSADEMTLLHHYCYRSNLANLRETMSIKNRPLFSYITDYYSNANPPISEANYTRWLETSSLDPSIRNSIHESTVMAILQYIIESTL